MFNGQTDKSTGKGVNKLEGTVEIKFIVNFLKANSYLFFIARRPFFLAINENSGVYTLRPHEKIWSQCWIPLRHELVNNLKVGNLLPGYVKATNLLAK